MGLHVGQPRSTVNPVTRRTEYVGAEVKVASHITALAQGGQVIMSKSFWKKLQGSTLAKDPDRCIYIDKRSPSEGDRTSHRISLTHSHCN